MSELVLIPRDLAERVTEIANRNEQSAEGDRLAALLSSPTPSLPEDVARVVEWLVDRAKTHEELAALGKQAEPWPDLFHKAAALIQSLSSQLAEARAERDEARGIVRDIYWMAVRYADGRKSYAVGMCNDALRKAYDAGWLVYKDDKHHDLDPQYARDGMFDVEWRSALDAEASRAEDAEAERDRLAAENEKLREAAGRVPEKVEGGYLYKWVDADGERHQFVHPSPYLAAAKAGEDGR